jgi:hypothetical protein
VIAYPDMRNYMIESIRTLADEDYQRRVWINGDMPNHNYEDCFDFAINCLFDDLALNTDGAKAIGAILKDEVELTAVQNLVKVLDELIDRVGQDKPDTDFVNSQEWPMILRAAKNAYKLLTNGKDPQGMFEEKQKAG